MLQARPFCLLWTVWKARNKIIFKNEFLGQTKNKVFLMVHAKLLFFDLQFMGSRYSLTRKFQYLCNESH